MHYHVEKIHISILVITTGDELTATFNLKLCADRMISMSMRVSYWFLWLS